MTEAEQQVIRLLTELRDAQLEEMAYRRRVLDDSTNLQRRAFRLQRIALFAVLVLLIGAFVTIAGLFAIVKLIGQ